MDIPIRFPSDADVIREDARRFRALPPPQRVRELGEMYRLYHWLLEASPVRVRALELAEQDERAGRAAIEEFSRRHGSPGP